MARVSTRSLQQRVNKLLDGMPPPPPAPDPGRLAAREIFESSPFARLEEIACVRATPANTPARSLALQDLLLRVRTRRKLPWALAAIIGESPPVQTWQSIEDDLDVARRIICRTLSERGFASPDASAADVDDLDVLVRLGLHHSRPPSAPTPDLTGIERSVIDTALAKVMVAGRSMSVRDLTEVATQFTANRDVGKNGAPAAAPPDRTRQIVAQIQARHRKQEKVYS